MSCCLNPAPLLVHVYILAVRLGADAFCRDRYTMRGFPESRSSWRQGNSHDGDYHQTAQTLSWGIGQDSCNMGACVPVRISLTIWRSVFVDFQTNPLQISFSRQSVLLFGSLIISGSIGFWRLIATSFRLPQIAERHSFGNIVKGS